MESPYSGSITGGPPVRAVVESTFETAAVTEINFSQRSVGTNVERYMNDMINNKWDWRLSGPLRVMEVEGQLVSYDNRRLMAAQNAGLERVPIQRVNPQDIMPGSKRTWEQAFERRRNDPRNIDAGGPVPPQGLKEQPQIR